MPKIYASCDCEECLKFIAKFPHVEVVYLNKPKKAINKLNGEKIEQNVR